MTDLDILQGTETFMLGAKQLPCDGWNDPATRELRRELLGEELLEYLNADDIDDLQEVVDGLLDIVVVAQGTRLTYGRSDATWIVGYHTRSFWNDPEARQRLRKNIEESAHWYYDAEDRDLRDDALIHLANLIQYCANALDAFVGGDVARACADEVTSSNLSKIDLDNMQPWELKPNGKVAKGPKYRAPDIAGVLDKAGLLPKRSHDLVGRQIS